MPQVDRCSRCNYGPVRGYGTLCKGCEEFLDWEAAEKRRHVKAERRRAKLQRMDPADRTIYVIAETVGYVVLIAAVLVVMMVAYGLPDSVPWLLSR
jgi:hypothetical protein